MSIKKRIDRRTQYQLFEMKAVLEAANNELKIIPQEKFIEYFAKYNVTHDLLLNIYQKIEEGPK